MSTASSGYSTPLVEQTHHPGLNGSVLRVLEDETGTKNSGDLLLLASTERLLLRLEFDPETLLLGEKQQSVDSCVIPVSKDEDLEKKLEALEAASGKDSESENGETVSNPPIIGAETGEKSKTHADTETDPNKDHPDFIPFSSLSFENEVADGDISENNEVKNDEDSKCESINETQEETLNKNTATETRKKTKKKTNPQAQAAKESAERLAATPEELKRLKRVSNLMDVMRSTVMDISMFKHRNLEFKRDQSSDNTKDPRRNAARWSALEHQRSRLQHQQRQQSGTSTNNSSGGEHSTTPQKQQSADSARTNMTTSSEENDEHRGEDGDEENDVSAVIFENPWIRLIRTLNSLAVVTPLLLDVLFHPHRNNTNIQLDETHLRKNPNRGKRRREMCWLFAGRVYDMVAQSSAKGLCQHLAEIYQAMGFLPVTEARDDYDLLRKSDWRGHLDHLMMLVCQAAFENNKPSMTRVAPSAPPQHHHPFESLLGQNEKNDGKEHNSLEHLEQVARQLDAHFGFASDTCNATNEEQQELDDFRRAIDSLQKRASILLHQRFPHDKTRLSVYGSCLSQLTTNIQNSDVDMSLYLHSMEDLQQRFESGLVPASKYDSERKSIVYQVCRKLERYNDFVDLIPVAHARVPVIKGTWIHKKHKNVERDDKNWRNSSENESGDGEERIAFDICLCNDIAVVNSNMIREYCSVDPRVPVLCKAVKKWAKQAEICTAANNTLSSYTWINLVLVYLVHHLKFLPNLQSPQLAVQAGVIPDPEHNPWHKINNLDTFYLTWQQAHRVWQPPTALKNISVTALLYGFWEFWSNDSGHHALFLTGLGRDRSDAPIPKTAFRSRIWWFWCVEDPFELATSHCPHDLVGAHVGELSVLRIAQCVAKAYQHLRTVLTTNTGTPPPLPWPTFEMDQQKHETSGPNGQGRNKASQPQAGKKSQGSNTSDDKEKTPVGRDDPSKHPSQKQENQHGHNNQVHARTMPPPPSGDKCIPGSEQTQNKDDNHDSYKESSQAQKNSETHPQKVENPSDQAPQKNSRHKPSQTNENTKRAPPKAAASSRPQPQKDEHQDGRNNQTHAQDKSTKGPPKEAVSTKPQPKKDEHQDGRNKPTHAHVNDRKGPPKEAMSSKRHQPKKDEHQDGSNNQTHAHVNDRKGSPKEAVSPKPHQPKKDEHQDGRNKPTHAHDHDKKGPPKETESSKPHQPKKDEHRDGRNNRTHAPDKGTKGLPKETESSNPQPKKDEYQDGRNNRTRAPDKGTKGPPKETESSKPHQPKKDEYQVGRNNRTHAPDKGTKGPKETEFSKPHQPKKDEYQDGRNKPTHAHDNDKKGPPKETESSKPQQKNEKWGGRNKGHAEMKKQESNEQKVQQAETPREPSRDGLVDSALRVTRETNGAGVEVAQTNNTNDIQVKTSEIIPGENDVMVGIKNQRHYAGNGKLQEFALQLCEEYIRASTRRQKACIVEQLLQEMDELKPPARFLKCDSKTGAWVDGGRATGLAKGAQTLLAVSLQKSNSNHVKKNSED